MLSLKGWYGLGRTVAASEIDSQVSQIDYNWTASLTGGGGGGGGGCLQIFSCLKLEQQIAETTVDKGNCCTAEKMMTNKQYVCVCASAIAYYKWINLNYWGENAASTVALFIYLFSLSLRSIDSALKQRRFAED